MRDMLARIAREPLAQFALIGLVILAADLATREETADPRMIHVTAEVHRELAGLFEDSRHRLPTPAEMDTLVERYVQNEALFREARELRLDEGDPMMRERLGQRMRLMMYSGIEVDTPPEAELRAWYDANADAFRAPATLSFRVIGLNGEEAEATALADRLNAGTRLADALPGRAVPVSFAGRPRHQLTGLFGETFVAAVEQAPEGAWQAVSSPKGWQVVRFEGSTPENLPAFDDVAQEVAAEWRADAVRRDAKAALDALLARYPTRFDPYGADVVAPEGDVGTATMAEGAQAAPAPSEAIR